jgi:hypothetical protein
LLRNTLALKSTLLSYPFSILFKEHLRITLGDQGKHGEAAAMFTQVLEKMQRILGEEHTFVRRVYTDQGSHVIDSNLEAAKQNHNSTLFI